MNAMLSEALREFNGLLHQLLTNLLGNDAETWGNELRKFLRKEPCWTTSLEPLLIPIGTVDVVATASPFVARDRFVVNTKQNAPVKIAYLWDDFRVWFTDKVEQPFEGSTLKYGKLSRSSVDGSIIAELGGEEKAETTLAEIFSLMATQPNGESGPLLTNGYANIFYVRDAKGVLRAVRVRWYADGGGWRVNALSVTGQDGWFDGRRVFSRNSR